MKGRLKITEAMIFELVILVFLCVLIFASSDLPARTKRLPLLIAWVTVILTLSDILVSILKQLSYKKEAPPTKISWDKNTIIKTGGSVLFMFATIMLWELLGFIITSIIITIVFALFMGAKDKIGLILASIGLTLGLYYVFGTFLNVPLPQGMLLSQLF